jgi:hypothetical protein
MDYSQDTEVQREILAQVQKIKDAQKQKLNDEEEKRKQAYIQYQAEIMINSEKYEALNKDEKNQLLSSYYHAFIDTKPPSNHKTIMQRNFWRKYNFMNNIIEKYDIYLKSHEYQEILRIEKEEILRIEKERKDKEAKEAEEAQYKQYLERIEQLNKSLGQFIRGKGTYQAFDYPFQISHEYSYLNYCMSRKDPEFVEIFWNYIDRNGGFSKCPTCGNTPKVMRFGECRIRQVGNMVSCSPYTTRCVENLFFGDSYNSPPIENIYCCEHLYDFSNKKRYILAEKVVFEKPKKEFHTNTHQFYGNVYKTTSYVEYNPLDPYGEETKKQQDKLASLKELEELETRMKILKQSLNL